MTMYLEAALEALELTKDCKERFGVEWDEKIAERAVLEALLSGPIESGTKKDTIRACWKNAIYALIDTEIKNIKRKFVIAEIDLRRRKDEVYKMSLDGPF